MATPLIKGQSAEHVLADKGYDSDEIIMAIQAMNANPVVPPRSHRKTERTYDKHLYKERSAIECMFGKLKQFRRIATRYDKLATSYLSFVYLGAIWLRLR